jgi:hypothetical protein
MCMICIDLDRGTLRPNEARRALSEMRAALPPGHAEDVEQKVEEAEQRAKASKTP